MRTHALCSPMYQQLHREAPKNPLLSGSTHRATLPWHALCSVDKAPEKNARETRISGERRNEKPLVRRLHPCTRCAPDQRSWWRGFRASARPSGSGPDEGAGHRDCPMQPPGRLPYSMSPNWGLIPRNSEPPYQRFDLPFSTRRSFPIGGGSASARELATSYRSNGRRASTRSSMIWKSPRFSVRRGTPSTWAVAAMARSIWRRLGLPPRRATAAAS